MAFDRKHITLLLAGFGILALVFLGIPTSRFADTALAQPGIYDVDTGQQITVTGAIAGGCNLRDLGVTPPSLIGLLSTQTAPGLLGRNAQGGATIVEDVDFETVDGDLIYIFELTLPNESTVFVRLNTRTGTCTFIS